MLGCVLNCLVPAPQVRLSMEAVRAEAEDFNTKAYKMSKANKDDRVVTVLKDQLEEFKQVGWGSAFAWSVGQLQLVVLVRPCPRQLEWLLCSAAACQEAPSVT